MPLSRHLDDGVIVIRIVGALGCVLGVVALIAGLANAASANADRDIRALIVIGVYIVLASIATIALRKIGAVLLVVPLAVAGIATVVGSAWRGGPAIAVVLNAVVSLPLLCSPAIIVWRHRRSLR